MTRRKDGLWQQQMTVFENGRKKQKCFYGKTKADVLKKIAVYKEESEKGALFRNIADEWWEQHEYTLSPTSISAYKRGLRYAKEYFGQTYIKTLRPVDINRYITKLAQDRNMAQKTAANALMVVKLISAYAVTQGYIDINPTHDVKINKKLRKSKRDVPTLDDISKIKKSLNCTFGLFAYFAMYTGLRKGELLALRWEDIDFDNNTITVNKSVYNNHNRPELKLPKTEAGIRTIPLLNKLKEVIVNHSSGTIFNKDGKMLTEKQFRVLYEQYKTESGVSCTAHQLRHLYATMLFENDVNVKDAQRLLGHAQVATTQDIYTHFRKAREALINKNLLSIDIDS